MGRDYIVGMGEVLWDMFPGGKELGGAPCNFAFHVSQLGLAGLGVSAVGNDRLGDEILSQLGAVGLDCHIDRVDFPTGVVNVTLDGAGVPSYEIKEGVAWDNIPFTRKLELVAMETRAVCFGSLAQRNCTSRETIDRFLEIMPEEEGMYRIFDINLRQHYYTPEIVKHSLWKCNILKLNDDEINVLAPMLGYGEVTFQDVCWKILDHYKLRAIILTCGTEGSYVFSPSEITFRDTPKVDVVDTVGAGDAFTAAFISALIKGRSLEFAHDLAVDVSAFVCTRQGAMPELPASLKSRLK